MQRDDLIVLRTFPSVIEAELARSALEAANVEAMVQADDAGGMRPHLAMSRVGLLVRAEEAEAAREVLGSESD